jgi:hypothetical protein
MTWHASSEALGPTFDKKLYAFELQFDSFVLFTGKIYLIVMYMIVREKMGAALWYKTYEQQSSSPASPRPPGQPH